MSLCGQGEITRPSSKYNVQDRCNREAIVWSTHTSPVGAGDDVPNGNSVIDISVIAIQVPALTGFHRKPELRALSIALVPP